MRKIYLYIFLLAFVAVSCDDDCKLDIEIDTTVCMPNSGLQVITSTELENDIYKLSLYKGGYNKESIAIELAVSQVVMDGYNNKNGTSYVLLPDKYYSFDSQVVLTSNEIQSYSNVKFNTSAMFADGIDDLYVLPLIISSPEGEKVNTEKNSIIISLEFE